MEADAITAAWPGPWGFLLSSSVRKAACWSDAVSSSSAKFAAVSEDSVTARTKLPPCLRPYSRASSLISCSMRRSENSPVLNPLRYLTLLELVNLSSSASVRGPAPLRWCSAASARRLRLNLRHQMQS